MPNNLHNGWFENPGKSEVLKRLDEYRAIEISNLWQRSVFLGTFLLLGYTGYGFLLDKMLSSHHCNELRLLHFLACALACINIVFSALWIAMAKGSKAWYESYENAIDFVENSERKLTWKEVRYNINTVKNEFYNIRLTGAKRHSSDTKNDSFFSTDAGGYSPAKINIAIGQISLVIWLIVLAIHVLILCNDNYQVVENTILFLLSFLIALATIIVMCCFQNCDKWIKSGYFSGK